ARISSKHRRRRKREGRFIEHVRFERAAGQGAPILADRCKRSQRAPFNAQCRVDGPVHGAPQPARARFQTKTWKPSRRLVTMNNMMDSMISASVVAMAAPASPNSGTSTKHSPRLIANAD